MSASTASKAIELKDDKVSERLIVKSLKARRGKATLADVVVDTGLPNIEAERLLRRMIGEYPCHLEVTEDGDILYEFDPAMRRREDVGKVGRWFKKAGAKSWAGFRVFMKALIAVVMVLYVVLFVVLIIAAMVASQRGNQSSSSRRGPSWGGRSHGGGSFWFWYFMFGRPGDGWRRHERHNPTYSRWARKSGRKKRGKDERPFYLKVYSFVLGPEPGDIEPLDDDKAVLAYIRERGGAVSTAEVASRTGWSLKQAESALTRMVARYEGNIAIDDSGQLVFAFAELRKTAGGKKKRKAVAYWERWEAKEPITGNSKGTNILVGALNSFNLVTAFVAPTALLPQLQIEATGLILFGVHYFPLAFSGLVFLIPAVRWLLHVKPENARRRFRNFRRSFYKAVFTARVRGTHWLRTQELVEATRSGLASHAYAPEPASSALERVVTRVAPELGGDFLPPEGDDVDVELGWRFDEVADGYAAAAHLREQLANEDADLRVVFSTEAVEGTDPLAAEIEAAAAESGAGDVEASSSKAEARVLH